jgi:hypothetical protein
VRRRPRRPRPLIGRCTKGRKRRGEKRNRCTASPWREKEEELKRDILCWMTNFTNTNIPFLLKATACCRTNYMQSSLRASGRRYLVISSHSLSFFFLFCHTTTTTTTNQTYLFCLQQSMCPICPFSRSEHELFELGNILLEICDVLAAMPANMRA